METKMISLEERVKDEAKSYLEELLREGAGSYCRRQSRTKWSNIWKPIESSGLKRDSRRSYAMVAIRNENW